MYKALAYDQDLILMRYTPEHIIIFPSNIENIPMILSEALIKFSCHDNKIKKIENLPKQLQEFSCGHNKITEIENLPDSLKFFMCSNNKITKIENLSDSLKFFVCDGNKITKIENLPISLKLFDCCNNQIDNVTNLPLGLTYFYHDRKFKLDNVPSEHVRFKKIGAINIVKYNCIKRLQTRLRNNMRAFTMLYIIY